MERLGVEAAGSGRRYKASYDDPAAETEEFIDDPEVKLVFPDPGERTTKPLVQLEGMGFRYPNQPLIFDGVDLNVDQRSRVALLGKNGKNGRAVAQKS